MGGSSFEFRHINRAQYPQRHVIVCEDNLDAQSDIARWFSTRYGPDHFVSVSFVCGSAYVPSMLEVQPTVLLLLDHDMPAGDGSDLCRWITRQTVPVVGAILCISGIEQNNAAMMSLLAGHGELLRSSSKAKFLRGEDAAWVDRIVGIQGRGGMADAPASNPGPNG